MVEPWVKMGYTAVLVDPQHPEGVHEEDGYIRVGHVVDHPVTWALLRKLKGQLAFVSGFPVCTDLAVSGARHFDDKRKRDVHFQARAMQLVHECRVFGELSGAPWVFENPVSVISSIYRPADFQFQPWEYGGYLPEDDVHPHYPDYYPPRDAYGKKNLLVDWRWLSDAREATCANRRVTTGHRLQQRLQQARRQVRQDEGHSQRNASWLCICSCSGAL